MKKIIFVCTGNTCRSPMAEVIAKDFLKNKDIEICSRGLSVFKSSPASDNSIEAVKKYNLDLSSHISKQLTADDVISADLVLTMSNSHREFIINQLPEYEDKIFTLYNYTKHIDKDIADPYGGSLETYISCCDEIYDCIQNLII